MKFGHLQKGGFIEGFSEGRKNFFVRLPWKWYQSTRLDELSIFVKKGFFVSLEIKKLWPFEDSIFFSIKGIFSHRREEEGRGGEQTLKSQWILIFNFFIEKMEILKRGGFNF